MREEINLANCVHISAADKSLQYNKLISDVPQIVPGINQCQGSSDV